VDATTAVPLDEVVRQDRPGVKITYRGNLSETGSISRLGGSERRTGASWNKNAPLSGGRGRDEGAIPHGREDGIMRCRFRDDAPRGKRRARDGGGTIS